MADKLTLPKAKFSHELTAAAVDPAMKAAEATSAKLYRVPVAKILPIPGFNVRVQSPDYLAHVDSIRASIAANGYDSTKPLAGYVAKNGDESVIYVTDGHTRLAAVQAFNADPDTAEKDEIASLPVLVQPKEVSLTDLTVQLHTANNGRPLTPFEMGVIVKRLLAEEGAKKADIATRLGVTPRYLDDVLLLANAEPKVKQHVAAGAVSSTMAIQLLRKDSDTAAEKIEEAVKKTAGTGKKATKKHATVKMLKTKLAVPFNAGDDMKEIVKAVAAQVRATVEAEEGEDDSKLSTVAGTINLVIETPAPAKAEPAPKAKAKPVTKTKRNKMSAAEALAPAEEPAEKPAKKTGKQKAKDTATVPAKVVKAKKTKAAIPVEGAEALGEDDEPAIMPPKVSSDPDVEEEVDI
jgi:ParB family chromosome partitioning protein